MRLLSEYMPVPEINAAPVKTDRFLDHNCNILKKETETPENRNLHLARQVEIQKNNLINELAKFPITALWILNKYQQPNSSDQDEESASSELSDFVKSIEEHYQLLGCSSSPADNEQASGTTKRRLISALQQFPFGFDDLVKIVDIVTYAFKLRGLSFQPTTLDKKQADIVLHRLHGVDRLGRANLSWHFKALELQEYDEQFLFMSSVEMNAVFADVVIAEHYWLDYRQQLASANAKLVLYIANQYKGNFLDFEDLVQEGHTGLLKAVDRFKYRLGFQFSTYAGYWIRQAISRALSRSERVVRIPCGQIATINRVFRAKDELIAINGKEPSIGELAEHTHLTEDEVNAILAISQSAVSLEAFDDDDDEQSFAPINFIEQQVFTPSFGMIATSQLEGLVGAAIKTLNPREATILCAHFGLGSDRQMTLQEIGTELNLTRERVRQIQVVALNKIKMRYGEQLVNFL